MRDNNKRCKTIATWNWWIGKWQMVSNAWAVRWSHSLGHRWSHSLGHRWSQALGYKWSQTLRTHTHPHNMLQVNKIYPQYGRLLRWFDMYIITLYVNGNRYYILCVIWWAPYHKRLIGQTFELFILLQKIFFRAVQRTWEYIGSKPHGRPSNLQMPSLWFHLQERERAEHTYWENA